MDHVQEYSKALCYHGLKILLHRDAIREGDGPRLINYWKHNLLQYLEHNHQKYLIYTVRLLTAVNGGVSERLREQILWNRTVNNGGFGKGISMDLMIEFLNKAFKGIWKYYFLKCFHLLHVCTDVQQKYKFLFKI